MYKLSEVIADHGLSVMVRRVQGWMVGAVRSGVGWSGGYVGWWLVRGEEAGRMVRGSRLGIGQVGVGSSMRWRGEGRGGQERFGVGRRAAGVGQGWQVEEGRAVNGKSW